ncbi:MAG TPA: hypothetical protein VEW74_10580, partial [Candidatus Nitrosotalea sp.]|nr:hypothetical protein [Candidatus Nitrosotalea sp.]
MPDEVTSASPFAFSGPPEHVLPILTKEQLRRIALRGRGRGVATGEVLIQQGQSASHFFAVL